MIWRFPTLLYSLQCPLTSANLIDWRSLQICQRRTLCSDDTSVFLPSLTSGSRCITNTKLSSTLTFTLCTLIRVISNSHMNSRWDTTLFYPLISRGIYFVLSIVSNLAFKKYYRDFIESIRLSWKYLSRGWEIRTLIYLHRSISQCFFWEVVIFFRLPFPSWLTHWP